MFKKLLISLYLMIVPMRSMDMQFSTANDNNTHNYGKVCMIFANQAAAEYFKLYMTFMPSPPMVFQNSTELLDGKVKLRFRLLREFNTLSMGKILDILIFHAGVKGYVLEARLDWGNFILKFDRKEDVKKFVEYVKTLKDFIGYNPKKYITSCDIVFKFKKYCNQETFETQINKVVGKLDLYCTFGKTTNEG